MHRFLEKFSAVMSVAVVWIYLGGMIIGTASYFVGRAFNLSREGALAAGVALALAVEVHSFLSQRLTRSHWQALSKLDEGDDLYAAVHGQYVTHLRFTIGLVAFSVFNSISFWAIVNNPQTWGDWIQVAVRGAAVPCLFLAAGFLTKLNTDAADMLAEAARNMLEKSLKTTTRQWDRRMRNAEKKKINLAPVAAALMEDARDPDGARRVRLIDSALTRAEGGAPAVYMTVPGTGYEMLPEPAVPSPQYRTSEGDPERFSLEDTGPQKAVRPGSRTPSRLPAENGSTTGDDRRVMAFALLEKNPTLSRDRLRDMLRCSTQEASDHKSAWQTAQRRNARARREAEAGGSLYLEPTHEMLAVDSLEHANHN